MNGSSDHRIVQGISVTAAGQATVDPSIADVLFDLAVQLGDQTDLPVDVEHVVAAIVLASRGGELDPNASLSSDDPMLIKRLEEYVKTVFVAYGGKVGQDD